jgi:hypothetical protein
MITTWLQRFPCPSPWAATPTDHGVYRGLLAGGTPPRNITELVESYAYLPVGTVAASVIALTERLALPAVATLDHRHFTVVRPRHISALTLLP